MSGTAIVKYTPLQLVLPLGALVEVDSLPSDGGFTTPDDLRWQWDDQVQRDLFGSKSGPKVVFAPKAERRLDGVLVKDQMALFSGHECDAWNGVFWPALIGLPEISEKKYLPVSSLSSLEMHLLAAATGLIFNPDVLVLTLSPGYLANAEKEFLKARLARLAAVSHVAILQVNRRH